MRREFVYTAIFAVAFLAVARAGAQDSSPLMIARQTSVFEGAVSKIAADRLGDLFYVNVKTQNLDFLNVRTGEDRKIYTPDGTILDLVIDPRGQLWIVVLSGGQSRILKLSPNAGDYLFQAQATPVPVEIDGVLNPVALAVDASGILYVADGKRHCVLKTGPDGTSILISNLPNPQFLAIDSAGAVYVADFGLRVLLRYKQGEIEPEFSLEGVSDIATDPSGNVYMAMKDGVIQIGSDGRVHANLPVCPSGNHRITISPTGRLFASGPNGVYELPTRSAIQFDLGAATLGAGVTGQMAVCGRSSTPPNLKISLKFSISGANAADFNETDSVSNHRPLLDCSGGISATDMCTIVIHFAPSETSSRTGTLSIQSSHGTWIIPLSGTGVL